MTREQMDRAISGCLEALREPDGQMRRPARGSTDKPMRLPVDAHEAKRHLAWMCEQMPTFFAEGKLDKAQRWLGFVQGGVWALGLRTVDQMREDNR